MTSNQQWLIDGQPRGRALLESDFKRQTTELSPLEAGRARVKVEVLGLDPSMKGQMENIGYAAATSQGDVMGASGIGEVVESNDPSLKVGAKVLGRLGWQEYASVRARDVQTIEDDDLLTARLGPLGGTGLTALEGLGPQMSVSPNLEHELFGQGVHNRDTHAVQTAGHLVGTGAGIIELSAGMENGHHDFRRRLARLLFDPRHRRCGDRQNRFG